MANILTSVYFSFFIYKEESLPTKALRRNNQLTSTRDPALTEEGLNECIPIHHFGSSNLYARLRLDPLPPPCPRICSTAASSCWFQWRQCLSSHTEFCISAVTYFFICLQLQPDNWSLCSSTAVPPGSELFVDFSLSLLSGKPSGAHTTLKDFLTGCFVSWPAAQLSAVKIKMRGVTRILAC